MGDADTIAAIATAPGRGGIGIVRVSGPAASAIASRLTGRNLPPRLAVLANFSDALGERLDEGIALYFPAPASYTGEDVLELQGHGGPVVLSLVLRRCIDLGARVAEPGEFTRRAFLNDKLDLAQAEAVADLIEAATERAARSATRSLAGEFSRAVAALQEQLSELRVLIEASFDFPEEGIDALLPHTAAQHFDVLASAFSRLRREARQGKLLREGIRVALIGAPNVGKSSLINALCSEEIAIVTPVPGTTRDLVRASVAISGVPVELIDTAGIRSTDDPVESMGVARARTAAQEADVVLQLFEDGATHSPDPIRLDTGAVVIRVHNKIDLSGGLPHLSERDGVDVWISATLGSGIDLLRQALLRAASSEVASEGEFMARTRHLAALEAAATHVARASQQLSTVEFVAEELRLAQRSLSDLTGEVSSDDLLGEIFSRFCIGK